MAAKFCPLTLLFLSLPVFAASECYYEGEFPAALQIEPAENGVDVVLGGNAAREPGKPGPVVSFDGKRWRVNEHREADATNDSSASCKEDIPLPALPYVEAIRFRDWAVFPDAVEQKVSVCERHGDIVFFGIEIYQGEGISGVGGVGRYDLKTGKLEVRRPILLRDSSVTAITYDGRHLWIGTGAQNECLGMRPTQGLIRYDWDTGLIAREEGFCGFIVHDLRFIRGVLWAASDMGVSRRGTEEYMEAWTHWTYDPTGDEPMREEGCMGLYARLLPTLSTEFRPAGGSAAQYFLEGLISAKPKAAIAVLHTQLTRK